MTRIAPPALAMFVAGRPRPQGSKVLTRWGGMREASKYVKAWRESIRLEAAQAWEPQPPLLGPIDLRLEFVMPRPARMPKRQLTPPATKRPDWDKLARAVGDSLTDAGIYSDDSQVVRAAVYKRIAEFEEDPGVHIYVAGLEEGWARFSTSTRE